ncbi:MAG: hypothetical protein ACE5GV_07845 [Candidatus Scalindua sp.]
MPALLSWLLSAFGSWVGYSVVRFTAMKIFIWTLVITIVPVLFSRAVYMLIEGVMTTLDSVNGTYGVSSYLINFTGITAWFAIHLKVVEGFALIMSAVAFRMAIRMIPFVRL